VGWRDMISRWLAEGDKFKDIHHCGHGLVGNVCV
jgi:hypothetical protein